MKYCDNCHNVQSTGDYCSKCGKPVKEKPLIEDITATSSRRNPSSDYKTLRFVSDVLQFIGVVIVVVSVLSSCSLLSGVSGLNSLEGGRPLTSILGASGVLGSVIVLVVGISLGLGEIAAGQLIEVFLDIRDDVKRMTAK